MLGVYVCLCMHAELNNQMAQQCIQRKDIKQKRYGVGVAAMAQWV